MNKTIFGCTLCLTEDEYLHSIIMLLHRIPIVFSSLFVSLSTIFRLVLSSCSYMGTSYHLRFDLVSLLILLITSSEGLGQVKSLYSSGTKFLHLVYRCTYLISDRPGPLMLPELTVATYLLLSNIVQPFSNFTIF